jgi:large subunit ribosomal protein L15
MPLYRRLPKRGFKNVGRAQIETISLSDLEKFDDGADVTIEALLEKGIIRDAKDGVKVLGNGELTKKVNVAVNAYSASAKAKIEELGGKAEVI